MVERFNLVVSKINGLVNKGQQRSVKAKKNIIASFIIKGLSICISLVVVPLTIDYINPSRYGIWLTISSIVGWFSFFDIGLSHGLRNKLAEEKAKGNVSNAQTYVSTTYAVIAIIFTSVWVIFLIVNHFLNWATILNVSGTMQQEVSTLAVIVFTYFCLQFVLRIISTIVIADQQPAKASLIDLSGQIASLVAIIFLVKFSKGSLVNLGLALCISPIIALVCANIFFFRGKYKAYRPLISKVDFTFAKGLFNIGVIFFVIQVSNVIQFESANIIIARSFGTQDVTSYNIVYKYFGMLIMLFTIFLNPFWSAATEAYAKGDLQWIKSGIKRYNLLNLLLFGVSIVMLVFSKNIYDLWLGKGKVPIDFSLSFWGFLFVNFFIFGSKYVHFLNGISALKMQFWTSIVSPFVYVLVAMLLIKYYNMGVYSLFIAALVANLNGIIVAPVQYYQVVFRNKKGIWIK